MCQAKHPPPCPYGLKKLNLNKESSLKQGLIQNIKFIFKYSTIHVSM
jgi:hypothetical protein